MNREIEPQANIDNQTLLEAMPFNLLSEDEMQVLQGISDGLTGPEIRQSLGFSKKTVEKHKRKISMLGAHDLHSGLGHGRRSEHEHESEQKTVILGLVVHGVSNGYIKHELPMPQDMPLTPAENRVMESALNGKSKEEIASEFSISISTVKMQMEKVYGKLDTRNVFHTAARVAYLKTNGLWLDPLDRRTGKK